MSSESRSTLTALACALVGVFLLAACSEDPIAPETSDAPAGPLSPSRVIHHVSVGGADVCTAVGESPGCDANFSLTAVERADGTVRGRWQDTFALEDGGALPVHIRIDRLNVDGNEARLCGIVVSEGPFEGGEAFTWVADNGNSVNDPLDQITFTLFPFLVGFDCDFFIDSDLPPAGFRFDLHEGQVVVR